MNPIAQTQDQSRSPIFQKLHIVSNLLDESYEIKTFSQSEDSDSKKLLTQAGIHSNLASLNSEEVLKNSTDLNSEILENSSASVIQKSKN
jgi:hypothetical protein